MARKKSVESQKKYKDTAEKVISEEPELYSL